MGKFGPTAPACGEDFLGHPVCIPSKLDWRSHGQDLVIQKVFGFSIIIININIVI